MMPRGMIMLHEAMAHPCSRFHCTSTTMVQTYYDDKIYMTVVGSTSLWDSKYFLDVVLDLHVLCSAREEQTHR